MKKENQRVFLTKQMLKNALLALLESRHIDKISVKELCDEAGVNRSTFYRYYTLPKELLLEIQLEMFQRFEIKQPFRNQADVRVYLEKAFQCLYDNVDLVRILTRNTTPDDYTVLMQDFAMRLLETTDVKDASPQKIRLMLAYIGAGSFYTIRQWLSDEEPLRPEELIDFTIELTQRSLRIVS